MIYYEELTQAVIEAENSHYLSACHLQTKDPEKPVVQFSPSLKA